MTKIKIQTKISDSKRLRVRIIKAPLVDSNDLRCVLFNREKAIVL